MPEEKHEQRPAQQHQPTQQQPAPKSGEQPARPTPQSSDEVMEIRKQAGSIGEVIEPVQRVRQERTNP